MISWKNITGTDQPTLQSGSVPQLAALAKGSQRVSFNDIRSLLISAWTSQTINTGKKRLEEISIRRI